MFDSLGAEDGSAGNRDDFLNDLIELVMTNGGPKPCQRALQAKNVGPEKAKGANE